MRLRPVRYSILATLVCALTLPACSDESPIGPKPFVPKKAPVWSEITNLHVFQTMYGMWAESPTNIFAVGRGGQIWQWDGARWTQRPNANSADLFAIDGDMQGHITAVGAGGTVVEHLSGSFFTRDAGTTADLHDVWLSPSGQFVITAEDGGILRGSSNSWARDTTPVHTPLLSLWGASDTDAFAVGVDGTILRYDGSEWTDVASPTTEILAAVDGTSASDVYAAGASGVVIHFDGNEWSPLESHTSDLLQTCCADCGPGVAGANGSISRWTGSAFKYERLPDAPWLYAMTDAGSDTWVTGAHAVMRYDGTAWSSETRGLIPILRAMTSTPSTGLMVAGDNGKVMLGGTSEWSGEDAGATMRLNTMWTSPAGEVFAAGSGGIFYRAPTGWTLESSEAGEYYDIGGNDAHAFAVGKNGAIRERQGTGWKFVANFDTHDLHAIAMTADEGYIAGVGRILYYEHGSWIARYTNDNSNFWDIITVSTPNYRTIAVGANGLSLGRTGNDVWEAIPTPVTTTLYSLTLGPDGDVSAAGANGTLLQLVDDAWTLIPAPTTRTFLGVWGEGDALFVCGGDDVSGGFLFRYGPPAE
ncbi:MAG TPA: hypothetical protein VFH33_03340 [Candidatus Krumholzibacteria bacterium]|nr:hypothetical protein [Candidatus Krumholzibacteria bacterium]